jgi:hypothetical protein
MDHRFRKLLGVSLATNLLYLGSILELTQLVEMLITKPNE